MVFRTFNVAAIACLLAVTCASVSGADQQEGLRLERWSRVARRAPVKGTDPVRLSASAWIRVFQRFVSPVDGPSCTYFPNCSAYGLQAIEKHGLLIGIPMTAERVMRNHRPDNPARDPLCEHEGQYYYLDPVESNDDWWTSKP